MTFTKFLVTTISIGCMFSCKNHKTEDKLQKSKEPNLLVIMTDEHSFRTLGSYRELLSDDQANVWGEGNNVETPNIDYLANQGILFSKFYATTPVCTPSRGAFVTGMYPQQTGITTNQVSLKDDAITFAEVLNQNGYSTGYAGKWHLDGKAKPGWAPKRKFGFSDNRYMFNRGHWKKMEITDNGPRVAARNKKGKPTYSLDGADEKSFTTDFLTDRAIDYLDKDKEAPFCYMISYPDPHGPDLVRPPYDTIYKGMDYKFPKTYNQPSKDVPNWGAQDKHVRSSDQAQYFGMVKNIDDNIGRLIDKLRDKKLLQNTIIVFTSDHGDLRTEHHRNNKSVPFETSAKVPFIVYYPKEIKAGGVIKDAFSSVDFAPSILALLNQKVPQQMQGTNMSELMLHPAKQNKREDVAYIRSTGKGNKGSWVAAITSRYKLILSKSETPWLIDMEKGPDELVNFISNPKNNDLVKELAMGLKEYNEKYKDPYLEGTKMERDLKKLLSM